LYNSKKFIVSGSRQSCSSQDHVDALKLRKMESDSMKNQVGKVKLILMCFIYLLSIGHRTIKRNAIW
jgi:hypothetical protein